MIARPNYALQFLAGKENIFLHKKSTRYTQRKIEQDTSLLDCKHKHMMKDGAPPDRFGVRHRLLPIEFHGFTSIIDF